MATITAVVNENLPGSVRLSVVHTAGQAGMIVRRDGALEAQPVRNYSTSGSGLEIVIDCEAPLGRPVSYALLDAAGAVIATTGTVTCDVHPQGWSLVRSVLAPQVAWMWSEPADETGIEWATSTTIYPVVGSDTPVVVGEIRQRHSGVLSFFCKSIAEADQMVSIMRDGSMILVRHAPCASAQTRDMLFTPLDVRETRWGRNGARLVLVSYQSSKFVPGDTTEPPFDWSFGSLRDSASNFQALSGKYATFADMAMNTPKQVMRR